MEDFIAWLKAWEAEYKVELTYCPEDVKAERIKQLERISTVLNVYEEFTESGAVLPNGRQLT